MLPQIGRQIVLALGIGRVQLGEESHLVSLIDRKMPAAAFDSEVDFEKLQVAFIIHQLLASACIITLPGVFEPKLVTWVFQPVFFVNVRVHYRSP